MRVILTIETSTAHGSLCVRRDGQTIYVGEFASERTHNSVLFAPLAQALALAPDLNQIVIGTGPGSYTGVRVGIAAALGVSMARSIPVCGACSLIALPCPTDSYSVLGDARRSLWHLTEIHAGQVSASPRLGTAAELTAAYPNTAPAYALDHSVAQATGLPMLHPHAEMLAKRVEIWTEAEWSSAHSQPLEPIYLSPPFITTAK